MPAEKTESRNNKITPNLVNAKKKNRIKTSVKN